MKTTITTEYYSGLGDFLYEKGILWENKSIDQVGDFIVIRFDKEMNASEIFGFTMDFAEFREKSKNQ